MPIRKKNITKDPKNFPNNPKNNLEYISRLKMTKTHSLLLKALFEGHWWRHAKKITAKIETPG